MANKIVRYTTPKGIAQYPWVIEADTKFIKEGQYHVQLDVPKSLAEGMITKLTELLEAEYNKLCKEKGKKLNKIPFFDEVDDNTLQFKFKQNKVIHRQDGQTNEVKIPLFDAKGKPIGNKIKLGNGSTIKVSYTVAPYYNATNKGVGLSLRLVAIQVIELVEYSAGNAESYGFGEEEGYESSDESKDDDPPFEETEEEGKFDGDY